MKRKIGIALIILGCGLISAALSLFIHNEREQQLGAAAAQAAVEKVAEVIREHQETVPDMPIYYMPFPTAFPERAMTEVELDGYSYIGYIHIPRLKLELPVMSGWSEEQLKISPCRYSGSTFSDDLVIMAHNYKKHFGPIRRLKPGDSVTFTDMDGVVTEYEVMDLEILDSTAIEDMIAGEYDLTLFTCTYGGEDRITLRCDKLEE